MQARRDLVDRTLAATPDVRLTVIESYGDVVLQPPLADAHRAVLDELEGPLTEAGWALASGRAASPTHGGRSWMADATVFTGIEVDRQATFVHISSVGRTIPSLPGFFAARGYSTVLVRPKDRARPGVRLVNHFGFATTVFHDELAYRGPSVGWGHIPDQYTVEVTERRFVAALPPPIFAFVHLATSHYPWEEPPPILDDGRQWQTAEGQLDFSQADRKSGFVLGMELSRFRTQRRALKDRFGADDERFQQHVAYDLRVLARHLATVRRPALVIWYGDHQPPFLADDEPRNVVVHVIASEPEWLEPFLADDFRPGLDPGPRGQTTLPLRDLFDRITAALAGPTDRGVRPED